MPEPVKIVVPATSLVNKASQSIDLVGRKFGRLLVSKYAFSDYRGRHWECVCDCGKTMVAIGKYLTKGDTKSCGCLRAEKSPGIGIPVKSLREYYSWRGAKNRCFNKNSKDYHRYGGRGLTMCETWKNNFGTFLQDMGFAPEGHSLERKDNDKGYCKENCIWATSGEQGRNTRNNILVTFDGVTKCVSEWLLHFGLKKSTYTSRMESGWTRERALSTPKMVSISRDLFELEKEESG